MPFLLYILIAVIALLLFSGLLIFYHACVRKKELQWMVEEEIKKTPYGNYYENIRNADAFLREHNAQNHWIESFDGLRLYASYVPAPKARGTIILAHGYRSSKLVDFGIVFPIYHKLGMNILVPDQRSHGMSEGKFITFGVNESRDMQSWIDYHNRNLSTCPIILSGLSMGASTMLYLADADLPNNVKGIIADCGFTSPKEIISVVFERVTHLPSAASLLATELFTRLFAGFSLTGKSSMDTLKKSKLPVLMVHGREDGFVPCEMTERGFAVCTGPKEMFLVDGADHGVSFLVEPDKYKQLVTDFLNKNLEERL